MCGIKCLKRRKKEYANWKMALLRGWKRKTWVNFRTCTTEAFRFERYSWLQLKGKIKAVFATKAGETICKEAKESNASMIVMGTRGDNPKSHFQIHVASHMNTCVISGMGTMRRTILGSVSDYVVHHAHCPVTVCRHWFQTVDRVPSRTCVVLSSRIIPFTSLVIHI